MQIWVIFELSFSLWVLLCSLFVELSISEESKESEVFDSSEFLPTVHSVSKVSYEYVLCLSTLSNFELLKCKLST